jgi:holo-[acyl-carrier protein] synthase
MNGNVIGIGNDVAEVGRIREAHERHGSGFLTRIFTKDEQAYCLDKKNPYPHFAARFAAKEAVSKAFGTGIGAALDWTSIEVVKGPLEEPLIQLDEKGAQLLRQRGGQKVLITLTHTRELAFAVAMILA